MEARLVAASVLASLPFFVPLSSTQQGPPGPEPNGALANNPLDAARDLYDNDEADIRLLSDSDFDTAFSNWDLYRVYEYDGVPLTTHAMAWNGLGGYDMTLDYNTILSLSSATINSESSTIKYAKPYANHANAEYQPEREWVDSGDSTRLNRTISDPSAEQSGITWTVELATYADENGVLANWTIPFKLNKVTEPTWETMEIMVATKDFNLEATNFREGVWLNNTYDSGSYDFEASALKNGTWTTLKLDPKDEALTEVWNATNYDNSTWYAYYPSADLPTNTTPIVDVARALVKAAKGAYENMTRRNAIGSAPCFNQTNPAPNWGYESLDPDCVLRIVIYDDDMFLYPMVDVAIVWSNNATILVSQFFKEIIATRFQAYLDAQLHDLDAVARTIIGHEFYHINQYGLNGLDPGWQDWYEGQARAAQSFDVPHTENHTTSFWAKSLQAYTLNYINADFCSLDYSTSPYWGYLYWVDGGLDLFNELMAQIDDAESDACLTDLPRGITKALEAIGSVSEIPHDDFNETMLDFALHLYTKNLTWGRAIDEPNGTQYDWGTLALFDPTETQAVGTKNYSVGAWGFELVNITAPGNFTVEINTDQDEDWMSRVFDRDCEGNITIVNLTHGEPATFSTYTCHKGSVVVTTYRKQPTGGEFELEVATN